jgi:hypothetical protein
MPTLATSDPVMAAPPGSVGLRPKPSGTLSPTGGVGSSEGARFGRRSAESQDAGGVERSLALGFRLLAAAESFAAAFAELGDIELPPVVGSDADQAGLRAAAPLYLASELESALLLPAVETLAGLFASGALAVDSGAAPEQLRDFWRGRKERFSAAERAAFFARLFGSAAGSTLAGPHGRNDAFEGLMIDLTEALSRIGEQYPVGLAYGSHEETRILATAAQLAANLAPRSGGMTAFAARDILSTTQQALEILNQPEVQHALGARSVWTAVRIVAERYLDESPDIPSHVTRGKSGLLVLAWLAETLPRLSGLGPGLAAPNDPVVGAATNWLQASLSLAEASAPRNQEG